MSQTLQWLSIQLQDLIAFPQSSIGGCSSSREDGLHVDPHWSIHAVLSSHNAETKALALALHEDHVADDEGLDVAAGVLHQLG